MEKKSPVEVNEYHILYLVGFLILILVFYSVYLSYLKSDIVYTTSDLDSSLIGKNSISNVCSNLSSEEQISCIIKTSECSSDDCLSKKAILIQDENLCFSISNDVLRVRCSAQVSHDKIIQSAVLEDNILVCNSFDDVQVQLGCINNYWYAKSVNLGDKSYCLNISVEAVKNECLN